MVNLLNTFYWTQSNSGVFYCAIKQRTVIKSLLNNTLWSHWDYRTFYPTFSRFANLTNYPSLVPIHHYKAFCVGYFQILPSFFMFFKTKMHFNTMLNSHSCVIYTYLWILILYLAILINPLSSIIINNNNCTFTNPLTNHTRRMQCASPINSTVSLNLILLTFPNPWSNQNFTCNQT